jgi:DNA-binding NarL/FixJ family response regulator
LGDILVSAALEGITDAVHHVSSGEGLTHDNLTGYVTDYIHRYVSRALEDQHTVRVPRTTMQDARAQGRTLICPSRVGFDDPALARRLAQHDELYDFEIKELVDKVVQSDMERKILELRQSGHSDAEIATELSLSKTSVFLIRKQVERRFLELFYG